MDIYSFHSLNTLKQIWKDSGNLFKTCFLIVLGFLLFVCVYRALDKAPGSDFYVFFHAGEQLLKGEQLYFWSDQDRQFLYPPFAAFIFSILSVFPFKVAAVIFSVFNLALWFYTLLLADKVISQFTGISASVKLLVLGFLFSYNFYFNNLIFLQVNLILYLFTLLFLSYYQQKKYLLASIFLAAAISFKVTPVVFLGWLFFRGHQKAFFFTIGFTMLFFLVFPFLRGYENGVNDIHQFFQTLSEQSKQISGELSRNKSLHGFINNILTIFDIRHQTIKIINYIIIASFALSYVIWVLYLRFRKITITPIEFAGTYVIILLISSFTRDAHMVTLSFPFLVLLLISHESKSMKFIYQITILSGITFWFGNKDIFPEAWTDIFYYYLNVPALIMIVLYILCLTLSIKYRQHHTLNTSTE